MRPRLQLLLVILLFTTNAVTVGAKPNIIFILADDLGWSELGCYGNTFNETPQLDRMAKDGTRFTHAYAAAPVCSPYRAALLTGQHPARLGIIDYLRPNSANALSTDTITLPEMLQRHGYTTGMIGKWHLTGYQHHEAEYESRPTAHGFDWNVGSEVKGVGNGANTWPYVFRAQPIRWIDLPKNRLGKDEYLTDRLNTEAVDFIDRNKDKPFFLYLSHYAPHTILNGRADLVRKYIKKHKPSKSGRQNCYLCEDAGHGKGDPGHHWATDHNPHLAAMVESIDDGIGKIRAKLAALNLIENTIIIFSSDNGGETNITSNAPLRGGKSQLYEGGIRVPMIVQWKGKIPAGRISQSPIINTDFYPTLLEAAAIQHDAGHKPDGISTLANWKNPTRPTKQRPLHWHYPLDSPHFLGGISGGAIRDGDWKLIEHFDTDKTELYSLADDPSERNDQSAKHPDVVRKLQIKLEQWRDEVGARIPSAPLLTSPRRLYFADHFSGRASERMWYNSDWTAGNGILQRGATGTDNTRIFLRDAKYRDAMIRFDFQLQKSKDIRLVTGSNGHYNAVIHIRPDHFYIQTAKDETGPYFSYRHGEVAYDFDPNRWYTMTVEYFGDQLIAHVDRDHVAYAKHPILDKERTYFAFQVDDQPAAFDNIQIFNASKHANQAANLKHVQSLVAKYPAKKSLAEQYNIQKTNAHEWLYQRHANYRALVKKVDDLDDKKKQQFPDAFRSHKEFRKAISALRKKLLKEDPKFKELLHATYRCTRAMEQYLIEQKPEVADWPNSRRKGELERLRKQLMNSEGYIALSKKSDVAQRALQSAYPQLFITDDEINKTRKASHNKMRDDPTFRELVKERSAAWRAKEDYLFANDAKLAALQQKLKKP